MRATDQPAFRLDTDYERRLNRYGKKQYAALKRDEHSQADWYRSHLVDGPPIASGSGRNVYELPDDAYTGGSYDAYVLKLPLPENHASYGYRRDGRVQNRHERNRWVNNPSRWLVPVVAADTLGNWLVMPRGTPIAERSDEQAVQLQQRFRQNATLEELGRDLPDIDLLADNLVLLDNRPRLCDYGTVDS